MAEVILGGLVTSTFLNLVVVPILFLRWAGPAPRASERGASPQAAS
jgi:Cu/Ag efflux pump CusA